MRATGKPWRETNRPMFYWLPESVVQDRSFSVIPKSENSLLRFW